LDKLAFTALIAPPCIYSLNINLLVLILNKLLKQ